MKVLHINASTRGEKSESLDVAKKIITVIEEKEGVEIDTLNVFEDGLPPFDGIAVGAKMALFTGAEATADQAAAWSRIKEVFDRFASADVFVLNVPLWNNGIPYALKQFIDLVTQPGWAFGFDMEKGYFGLLTNRRAIVVHASGVFHEGIAPNFGSDFSTPYLDDWLKFIGVATVEHIHVAPTVVNADFASTKVAALQRAEAAARVI